MTAIKSEQEPKYRELNRRLREQITTGRFQCGEQIPTEQELARTYAVSRNTVRQAIALLENDAYLIRRRGAGTFVADLATDGNPVAPLEEVGFLLVDLPPVEGYALWETLAAQRWLAEREIHLSIAHLVTHDMLRGLRPGLLRPGACQALLLDGWVTPVHCELAREAGLAYLVLGNRKLDPAIPQARFALDRMIPRAVSHLHRLRPGQPVVLMIEPFALNVTHEIYQGYAEAVRALPQDRPILQTAEDHTAGEALDRLFETMPGPFSLITTDQQWSNASATYRRRGVEPEEYPVVVAGHQRWRRPDDQALCYWLPFSGERLIEYALPRFLEAYRQGTTDALRIELDVETIESPEQAG